MPSSDADMESWCCSLLGPQVRAKLSSSAYCETMAKESSPPPSFLTAYTFAPLLTHSHLADEHLSKLEFAHPERGQ